MNAVPAIRRATLRDVVQVQRLINAGAEKGDMLPRALGEIYENVRDYYVVQVDEQVIACCALHICWEDLAEIRSLVVSEAFRGKGLGRAMVAYGLREAELLAVPTVFALTLRPRFFEECGFRRADVASLPRKVWGECFHCPKFPNCDEVAVVHSAPEAVRQAEVGVSAVLE